jgi:hypothetical protein
MSTRLGLKPLTGLGAPDGFRASAMRTGCTAWRRGAGGWPTADEAEVVSVTRRLPNRPVCLAVGRIAGDQAA